MSSTAIAISSVALAEDFTKSKAGQTVEPDTVLRSDFDSVAADRERAKKLILKIDQALADAGLPADAPARTLIAENTGRWFEFPAVAQPSTVAKPVVTFDGMSAQELIGNELFEFQEATGFDMAAEYRAAIAKPAAVGAVEQDKLPLLTSAFRTTVSSGADKRYEMVFSFGDLTTLHAANREWLEFIRAAIAAKEVTK